MPHKNISVISEWVVWHIDIVRWTSLNQHLEKLEIMFTHMNLSLYCTIDKKLNYNQSNISFLVYNRRIAKSRNGFTRSSFTDKATWAHSFKEMHLNVQSPQWRGMYPQVFIIVVDWLAYNTRRIHILSLLTFLNNT